MSNSFHSALLNIEQVQACSDRGRATPLSGTMMGLFSTVRTAIAGAAGERTPPAIQGGSNTSVPAGLWLYGDGYVVRECQHALEQTQLVLSKEGKVTTDDFLNPDRNPTGPHDPNKMELYASITLTDREKNTKTVFYFFFNRNHGVVAVYAASYKSIDDSFNFEPTVHGMKTFYIAEREANFYNAFRRNEDLTHWFFKFSGL